MHAGVNGLEARCDTEGPDSYEFVNEEIVFDAVVRRLELIGEAAGRAPQQVRERHKGTEWRKIVGLRNVVFAGTRESTKNLRNLPCNSVPRLRKELRSILEPGKGVGS